MFNKLHFFIKHSINDLIVNKGKSLFAIICIATGIAAVVSLQNLSVMLSKSLNQNLQESHAADIRIKPKPNEKIDFEILSQGVDKGIVEIASIGKTFGPDSGDFLGFTVEGAKEIDDWFKKKLPGSTTTYRRVIASDDHGPAPSNIKNLNKKTEQNFVQSHIIDPDAYPLYGEKKTISGLALSDVLVKPTDIVISDVLAKNLSASVGDKLRLNHVSQDLTLTGIVPASSEGGFENVFGGTFGFYYARLEITDLFEGLKPKADRIFVKLADPYKLKEILVDFGKDYPYLGPVTTIDLAADNSLFTSIFSQLAAVLGIISLFLGGIGIMNTMQVIVNRRYQEIGILKTMGLNGSDITGLFLIQAGIMGFVGILIGVPFGWLASYLLQNVTSVFSNQAIAFSINPEPVLSGLVMGLIVTTFFGFMPTLSAIKVRPNIVLNPQNSILPKGSIALSALVLLILLVILGISAQSIAANLLNFEILKTISSIVLSACAIIMVLIAFIGKIIPGTLSKKKHLLIVIGFLASLLAGGIGFFLGKQFPAILIMFGVTILICIIYFIIWALIWLIGNFFPSFGSAKLKLAIRSFYEGKTRGARTLLALIVSIVLFSLMITVTSGVMNHLHNVLVDEAGGNIMAWIALHDDATIKKTEDIINQNKGVKEYSIGKTYEIELLSFYDKSKAKTIMFNDIATDKKHVWPLAQPKTTITARNMRSNAPRVPLYKGRHLTQEDAGKPYIVITANQNTLEAGFDVGDILNLQIIDTVDEPIKVDFEIIGMMDRTKGAVNLAVTTDIYVGIESIPPNTPSENLGLMIDVEDQYIPELKNKLMTIPGIFFLEISNLNDFITNFINQFTSLPFLISILALLVGIVVISNSVSLSAQERKRDIGILKALGLTQSNVLAILIIEYIIMGFSAGVIGTALGGISTMIVLNTVFGVASPSFPFAISFGLIALTIIITTLASLITAWSSTKESPLNVLRYE